MFTRPVSGLMVELVLVTVGPDRFSMPRSSTSGFRDLPVRHGKIGKNQHLASVAWWTAASLFSLHDSTRVSVWDEPVADPLVWVWTAPTDTVSQSGF